MFIVPQNLDSRLKTSASASVFMIMNFYPEKLVESWLVSRHLSAIKVEI